MAENVSAHVQTGHSGQAQGLIIEKLGAFEASQARINHSVSESLFGFL